MTSRAAAKAASAAKNAGCVSVACLVVHVLFVSAVDKLAVCVVCSSPAGDDMGGRGCARTYWQCSSQRFSVTAHAAVRRAVSGSWFTLSWNVCGIAKTPRSPPHRSTANCKSVSSSGGSSSGTCGSAMILSRSSWKTGYLCHTQSKKPATVSSYVQRCPHNADPGV